MSPPRLLSAAALLLAAVVALPLALHAWRRRQTPGAPALAVMAVAVTVWTGSAAIFCLASSAALARFCVTLEFLGIVALPPAWLGFALRFTGRHTRFRASPLAFAATVGLVMVTLVATNGQHHLVWHQVLRDERVQSEPGLAYWLFFAYAYLLSVGGIALIAQRMVESPPSYRRQCGLMVLAGLIPMLMNLLSEAGAVPSTLVDPTPFGFLASVMLVWLGLFRFGILDLVPVARTVLLEGMSDGLLVIDARERLLDLNRAACTLLTGLDPSAIGRPASATLNAWAELRQARGHQGAAPREVVVPGKAGSLYLEVRATALSGPEGPPSGWLFLLRDVTERRRIEAEREALVTQLRTALNEVKTLSGLLPICSACKKIRDDAGVWRQWDAYLLRHTRAQLTHGLCPDCISRLYPEDSP